MFTNASIETFHNVESAVSIIDYQDAYREAILRKVTVIEQRIAQLEAELSEKSALCAELNHQIDALKYQLVWMAKQIFGKKTEESKSNGLTGKSGSFGTSIAGDAIPKPARVKRLPVSLPPPRLPN